jgi:glycosyltransferase involved in cell wall biosynthesis
MKIALLSPIEESVPPKKYGGTELVVYNLAETLVDYGHEVYLLASGDSNTRARLVPIFPRAIRKESMASDINVRNSLKYIGIGRVVDELTKIKPDIIHNHIGWRFLPFTRHFQVPTLTTLHGPLDVPYQQFVYGSFSGASYVSISNAQREPFPKLNYVATVYNGIDLKAFNFVDRPGEYLAFLGRISPEKGPKIAIEVAKKVGMKLKIAAKVDTVDVEYFKKEIEPLIDGKQIEFIGEIGPDIKSDFLGNAYALLAPIQWREPFGLFIVEAMACGTPVIVTNMGSAPELVIGGETGFVVSNKISSFVGAIKKVQQVDRKKCYNRVRDYFTKEKMTEGYLRIYEKLIKK